MLMHANSPKTHVCVCDVPPLTPSCAAYDCQREQYSHWCRQYGYERQVMPKDQKKRRKRTFAQDAAAPSSSAPASTQAATQVSFRSNSSSMQHRGSFYKPVALAGQICRYTSHLQCWATNYYLCDEAHVVANGMYVQSAGRHLYSQCDITGGSAMSYSQQVGDQASHTIIDAVPKLCSNAVAYDARSIQSTCTFPVHVANAGLLDLEHTGRTQSIASVDCDTRLTRLVNCADLHKHRGVASSLFCCLPAGTASQATAAATQGCKAGQF